jgi:DNA processing protein
MCPDEGVRRARKLAEMLAADGVTVISGLAKGIDAAAHSATLDAGRRTIAVIRTGIPSYVSEGERKALRADRRARRGRSQFWPDSPPNQVQLPEAQRRHVRHQPGHCGHRGE